MVFDETEVSIREVDQALEQYEEDTPIIPKRIAFCANVINITFYQGEILLITCNKDVDDQDIEAVELPAIGGRRQFCCGECVERLLSPKPMIDLDEPVAKKKSHRTGINGNGGRPKPKQPKYVKEYE
jgi:hypothetical protein